MARLIWTPRARDELRDIRQYIARSSRQRAETFVERVDSALHLLAVFPLSGRTLPDDDSGELREIFVWSYRIIYRANDEAIEVAAIVHGARRLTDIPDPQE